MMTIQFYHGRDEAPWRPVCQVSYCDDNGLERYRLSWKYKLQFFLSKVYLFCLMNCFGALLDLQNFVTESTRKEITGPTVIGCSLRHRGRLDDNRVVKKPLQNLEKK